MEQKQKPTRRAVAAPAEAVVPAIVAVVVATVVLAPIAAARAIAGGGFAVRKRPRARLMAAMELYEPNAETASIAH